jgi:hypothetical protein
MVSDIGSIDSGSRSRNGGASKQFADRMKKN